MYGCSTIISMILIIIFILLMIYYFCLWALPYALIGGLIYILLKVFLNYQEKQRITTLGLSGIDNMSDEEFENNLRSLLERNGLQVTMKKESGDARTTIVSQWEGAKCAIQVVRQKSPISEQAVNDIVAAMDKYGCSIAMLLTDNYFTEQAKTLAHEKKCLLFNRDELARMILYLQGVKIPRKKKKKKLEDDEYRKWYELDEELEDYDYLDWLGGEDRPWIGPQRK